MKFTATLKWLNPFIPNAPFLYPLKTSDNRKVYWYFPGVGKGVLGTNGLIQLFKAVCNNAILLKNANDVFVQF